MQLDLTPEEARVLGALIEKELTTPDYYPLTLNALVNACNQKSNRDPVVQYNDSVVLSAVDRLRDRRFAVEVRGSDSRVPKYEQRIGKFLGLGTPQVSVLAVLLLRGPQTLGELRARTGRMFAFESMDDVSAALDALAEVEDHPLVMRLPLQPGRKEARYAHLLSGEPEIADQPDSGTYVPAAVSPAQTEIIEQLTADVAELKAELQAIREEFAQFRSQFE